MPKRRFLLLLWLLAGCACSRLQAQNFDFSHQRVTGDPLLWVDGLWRFHTGDNPAWAQPGFDDSHWPLLRTDRDWGRQGYKGYSGVAWYRFHVTLPPGLDDVSLELPHMFTNYEVYANGQLIGRFGKMPPHPSPYVCDVSQAYTIPRAAMNGRQVEIALRVWQWPVWAQLYGGGPQWPGNKIGGTRAIAADTAWNAAAQHWQNESLFLFSLLEALGAGAALALFLMRRSEGEVLWFALILACTAASGWVEYTRRFTISSTEITDGLMATLTVAGAFAAFAFYNRLFKARRSPLFWITLACLLVLAIFDIATLAAGIERAGFIALPLYALGACATLVLFLRRRAQREYLWFALLMGCTAAVTAWGPTDMRMWWGSLLEFPLYVWILSLLIARAWQNYLDARLLLAPVLLQTLAALAQHVATVTYELGWQQRWNLETAITNWPFPIRMTEVGDLLFLFGVLAILIHRFARTCGEEERYATEFAAARDVQRYLIPERPPETPGLTIQSEYRPAREVGGDFFQVLPHASDGSVLIVVGDVTGKGLHAGMLAALIVGAIRTAAQFTTDPARILGLLNERMQRRGYATCLALHIDAGGAVRLANAGHLPPYLNGRELPIEGTLPLGVLPDAEFPIRRLQLTEGDSLVLMTDGVAEAQDEKGQLFGFERVGEMVSRRSAAAALADAAQNFGQQDDITVLSVARTAAPAAVHAV